MIFPWDVLIRLHWPAIDHQIFLTSDSLKIVPTKTNSSKLSCTAIQNVWIKRVDLFAKAIVRQCQF